jgi:hypothetical protein
MNTARLCSPCNLTLLQYTRLLSVWLFLIVCISVQLIFINWYSYSCIMSVPFSKFFAARNGRSFETQKVIKQKYQRVKWHYSDASLVQFQYVHKPTTVVPYNHHNPLAAQVLASHAGWCLSTRQILYIY